MASSRSPALSPAGRAIWCAAFVQLATDSVGIRAASSRNPGAVQPGEGSRAGPLRAMSFLIGNRSLPKEISAIGRATNSWMTPVILEFVALPIAEISLGKERLPIKIGRAHV